MTLSRDTMRKNRIGKYYYLLIQQPFSCLSVTSSNLIPYSLVHCLTQVFSFPYTLLSLPETLSLTSFPIPPPSLLLPLTNPKSQFSGSTEIVLGRWGGIRLQYLIDCSQRLGQYRLVPTPAYTGGETEEAEKRLADGSGKRGRKGVCIKDLCSVSHTSCTRSVVILPLLYYQWC